MITHDAGLGSVLPALPSLPLGVATDGLLEILVGDLGMVLQGEPRCVPEPRADDVDVDGGRRGLQKVVEKLVVFMPVSMPVTIAFRIWDRAKGRLSWG